jgi:hypothetical protein
LVTLLISRQFQYINQALFAFVDYSPGSAVRPVNIPSAEWSKGVPGSLADAGTIPYVVLRELWKNGANRPRHVDATNTATPDSADEYQEYPLNGVFGKANAQAQ